LLYQRVLGFGLPDAAGAIKRPVAIGEISKIAGFAVLLDTSDNVIAQASRNLS